MNLIIETEKLFPYDYYPFLIIQPMASISSQEETKFETIIIITTDSTFGKLNSNIKLFHKAMTEEGKAIAEKHNQAYPNYNIKVFSRSEFLAKIKKTKDDNYVFITKYLDLNSLEILNQLENFKAKRYARRILEDVSNSQRLLSIGKELLKIYNDKNRKELEELRHRLYDKSLLEILHPVEFSRLSTNKIVNEKIFIISDSELLTEEAIKLLLSNSGFPYYQSVYDKLPKEFGQEFTALVFTKLDRITVRDLNNLHSRASRWLGRSKEKKIIMQGDKKSYENIQNLGYELRELPKYSEMQNKLTEVLLALISKHKKHFSFGFDPDYLIKNNSFKNLLKDFTSLEQMKDVITNSNTSIKLSTIEGWDEFLKDIPSKDESVPITSTIPSKTYNFKHNEGSKCWEISDYVGNLLYDKIKYKNNLEVKYFLYITKYCYDNKIPSENVVKAVGNWHGKNISKYENLRAENRQDNKNPFGHLIDHKLSRLKNKLPELKDIIERITALDYCYYKPNKMSEIKINLLDPIFPPNPASGKKKK